MTQTIDPAISLVLSPGAVAADNVSLFTVAGVVIDLEGPGDPIVGLVVHLAISGTGCTVTANNQVTGSDGSFTFTVHSTALGDFTGTLTVDPSGDNVTLDTHPTISFAAETDSITASGGLMNGGTLHPPQNGPLTPDSIWVVHGAGNKFGGYLSAATEKTSMVARDKYTLHRTNGVLDDPPVYTYVSTSTPI